MTRRSIRMTTRGGRFSELFNLKVLRVTDPAILAAKMTPVTDLASLSGRLAMARGAYVCDQRHGAERRLLPLVYALKKAKDRTVAEKPFDAEGKHLQRGHAAGDFRRGRTRAARSDGTAVARWDAAGVRSPTVADTCGERAADCD